MKSFEKKLTIMADNITIMAYNITIIYKLYVNLNLSTIEFAFGVHSCLCEYEKFPFPLRLLLTLNQSSFTDFWILGKYCFNMLIKFVNHVDFLFSTYSIYIVSFIFTTIDEDYHFYMVFAIDYSNASHVTSGPWCWYWHIDNMLNSICR